jgi:lysophospholipase L1-like esterase
VDFDAATRDPNDPKKLLAVYDSCDHLHPNDAGYKAMADSVDLGLFKAPQATARTAGR